MCGRFRTRNLFKFKNVAQSPAEQAGEGVAVSIRGGCANDYADCFYASAERPFDPPLEGRPVIILSNNDGWAVTCSPEAKALGIPVGEPWFGLAAGQGLGTGCPVQQLRALRGYQCRVMELLGRYSAWLEVYRVDGGLPRCEREPGGTAPWAGP
jgi:DNA polymerase V